MGSKVGCQLKYWCLVSYPLIVIARIEHQLQLTKSKADTLSDCLGSVAWIKNPVFYCFLDEVKDWMWEILHLVDHQIVDGWPGVWCLVEIHVYVVDHIHQIVATNLLLPKFILFIDMENYRAIIFADWLVIRSIVCLGCLNQRARILPRLHVGKPPSFDGWNYLGPHKVRGQVDGSIAYFFNSWPKVGFKMRVIDLKLILLLLIFEKFVGEALFVSVLFELNLPNVFPLQLLIVWVVHLIV